MAEENNIETEEEEEDIDLDELDAELDELDTDLEESDEEEQDSDIEEEDSNTDEEIAEEEVSESDEEGEKSEIDKDLDELNSDLEEPEEEEGEISDMEEEGALDEEEFEEEDNKEGEEKNIIEGSLFVAGRPIDLDELSQKTNIGKIRLKEILENLMMDYLMRPTSLEIVQIQDKFSLQIKPEYSEKIKKFAQTGLIPDKFLKTLTIIALKQPLMKAQLIKIRGSGAYDHVKWLIMNGFIEANKKGRSSELLTLDKFSDTFGLSRDKQTLKQEMIAQLGIKE